MRPAAAALAAALFLAGCTPGAAPRSEVIVLAASSLSGVFQQLASRFEAAHPGVTVRLSLDGSAALVDQLRQGAPADVLATADQATMDAAVAASLIAGSPRPFAANTPALIVPPGNPAGITGLDGSLAGSKLVVCAPRVPCGEAARDLARVRGVALHPVSEETRVGDVRAKVETGQADAGIVFATDARASGDRVRTIPVAGADQVRTSYLIGVARDARRPGLAAEFAALVTGPIGLRALAEVGFAR